MKNVIYFTTILNLFGTTVFSQSNIDTTGSVSKPLLSNLDSENKTSSIILKNKVIYSALYGALGGLGGALIGWPISATQSDGIAQGILFTTITAAGATSGFIWGAYLGSERDEMELDQKGGEKGYVATPKTEFRLFGGTGSNISFSGKNYNENLEFLITPKTNQTFLPNEYGIVFEHVDWYGSDTDGIETKIGVKINKDIGKYEFLNTRIFYGIGVGFTDGFQTKDQTNEPTKSGESKTTRTSVQNDFSRMYANIYSGVRFTLFDFINLQVSSCFEPIGAQKFILGDDLKGQDLVSINAALGLNLFSLN